MRIIKGFIKIEEEFGIEVDDKSTEEDIMYAVYRAAKDQLDWILLDNGLFEKIRWEEVK